MSEVVVKSQETKDGVCFRIYKNEKYYFANIKFMNYFYVRTIDYNIHQEDFNGKFTFCIEKVEPVGQYTKIILNHNFMRYKVKNFWDQRGQTFEADIKANKRYLLDHSIKLMNEGVPYTFYDIETDDRLPLQKDERGNVKVNEGARILSFAAVDYKGEKVGYLLNSFTDEDEAALLTMIIDYLAKYGLISGWYSEKFDMPYIKQRCDILGVNYEILDYVNHVDYKELFNKYDKKSRKSTSLNAISNEVLNESKIDQAKGEGRIYKTWLEDPDHLLKYNIEDSNLIYKINKKRMFIEVSMKRADYAGCHIRNTMNNSDSGDYLLLRAYKKAGFILPSKPTKDQLQTNLAMGKISGGFTRCLKPGYFKTLGVWDYKSFYPWTIATFNIDPMTFVERLSMDTDEKDYLDYIVTPSNFNEERQDAHPRRLFKKEKGVLPQVCLKLVAERDKIKYTMKQYEDTDPEKYQQQYLEQYARKTDANSLYGILAFPMSRYYNWDIADAVTTCCQAIIKKSYQKLEEWGCTVIGGDTDSTFVLLNGHDPKEIDEKFVEYYKELSKSWNVKEDELYINFEHEKDVAPMLFVKKKNYAYKEGEHITIKGLECIKSDANPLAAKMQEEFINETMNRTVDSDKWENIVETLNDKVLNQKMTADELVLTKGMSKMPKDYEGYVIDKKTKKPKIKADGTLQNKAIPAHVKLGARMLDRGVDLYPGSKIKFIVIKNKPILAIEPWEYEKGIGHFNHKDKKGPYTYTFEGEYDAPYYWLRVIKPLLKVVLTYYGELPKWGWAVTDSVMKKLVK